jgi:hypothetical protein
MMATTSEKIDPVREFLRVVVIALATAVGLAILGYFPTLSRTGQAGVSAMLVGLGIALVGAWVGSLPPFFFLHRSVREFPAGILAGLLVRFVGTMGMALGFWTLDIVPHVPLLIWVGVGQIVILAVDTIGMVRLARDFAGER